MTDEEYRRALDDNQRDRLSHHHPSDICECGPYTWHCTSCGALVVCHAGEDLAAQAAHVGDGRCLSCYVAQEVV